MTFIVILVALLIERFFDWSHLRQWKWFNRYEHFVEHKFPGKSPYFLLAMAILPLLVVVYVVSILMGDVFYGFGELIFDLVVLLYCLGPQNLWADAFAAINSLVHGEKGEKIKTSRSMSDGSYSQTQRKQFLGSIFSQANSRVFAIVFWFAIFGPVGAVLYRAITLSSTGLPKKEANQEVASTARSLEGVLDWVPVRLFTFLFALGGHFVQVLSVWRKNVLLGLSSNEMLLEECGNAALGGDSQRSESDGALERHAISLLDRSFVIMLVIMLVLVFVV